METKLEYVAPELTEIGLFEEITQAISQTYSYTDVPYGYFSPTGQVFS